MISFKDTYKYTGIKGRLLKIRSGHAKYCYSATLPAN